MPTFTLEMGCVRRIKKKGFRWEHQMPVRMGGSHEWAALYADIIARFMDMKLDNWGIVSVFASRRNGEVHPKWNCMWISGRNSVGVQSEVGSVRDEVVCYEFTFCGSDTKWCENGINAMGKTQETEINTKVVKEIEHPERLKWDGRYPWGMGNKEIKMSS